MKILILLSSLLSFTASYAVDKMAFIQTNEESMRFLEKNMDLLISEKIPVMVISDEDNEQIDRQVKRLTQKYPGLLIGNAPEPKQFLNNLLEQLKVKQIPSVVTTTTKNKENQ